MALRPKDSELSGMQRMAVSIVAAYYTAMLLMWTAPAVLQAKVAAEERALAAEVPLGETAISKEREKSHH